MTIPRATLVATLILAAGFVAALAVNWPGHLSYDSILQLHQGRAGLYNNWHPPVMAWLMGLFDAVLPGAGLFAAFDTVLVFGALTAFALLRPVRGGWPMAFVALVIVLSPHLLLYQGLVWKDVLFADSTVAGFACLAQAAARWAVFRDRALWLAGSFLLLSLAALTRQNGMILLPFAAAGLGWIAAKGGTRWMWAAFLGAGFLIGALVFTAGVSALLNLRSDGSEGPRGQLRLLQVYDLAGAVARQPGLPMESLDDDDPVLEQSIRTEGVRLYTPVRNDPLASSPRIAAALDDTDADPDAVERQWRALILEHPGLYLRVRAAAFWWVFATPDIAACRPVFTGIEGPQKEMREMGIAPRRDARDRALETYGKAFFGTPVWSHIAFGVLALMCLVLLLRRRRPEDLALAAMLGGAFAFAASFFVISIACDYRYLYVLDLSALAALLYLAREPLWRTP
ncbi:MAG TPA: hypothetical protein VHZ78_07295 [Rhizomicrobium sp.]|jgi:hypothetical protein|nr:hypothetical protein [Rhizomicrobium sp.]